MSRSQPPVPTNIQAIKDIATKILPELGLTEQQKIFCDAVLDGCNYRLALHYANYDIAKLEYTLQLPQIQEYLRRGFDKLEEHKIWSRADKLRALKKVREDFCVDGEKITCQDAGAMIKAIAEANRMQGHYAPEKSVNVHLHKEMDNKLDEMFVQYRREY